MDRNATLHKSDERVQQAGQSHAHGAPLHFMYYNFARRRQTLKGATPEMAAGIERHRWSLAQLAELLD